MKKIMALVLIFALVLIIVACGDVPDETTPCDTTNSETIGCGTEETTAISYTGMEGTFYVYEDQWQDYISGKRDDYEVITTATTPMETTADLYAALNALMAMPDVRIELADGRRYTPYKSLVYAQTNGGAVADGELILRSTENVLPHWVEEGLVPQIYLSDNMTLLCADAPLTDTCTFSFFTRDGDVYTKAATLTDATIDEVYRYGLEHFAGKGVYIRFDVTKSTESGHAVYAYLFSTLFYPMPVPTRQTEIAFSEHLPQNIVLRSMDRVITPYIQLRDGFFAEDDEGALFVNYNCTGRTPEQQAEDLLRDGIVFYEISRNDGVMLVIDGTSLSTVFEIYDEDMNFVGLFTSGEMKTQLDPAEQYYAAVAIHVDGRDFGDWREYFSFALWFKII